MADPQQPQPRRRIGALMVQNLAVGTKVKLNGGSVAEVTANPEDGGWIFVRYLSSPQDPSKEGTEEPVFCIDVLDTV